MNHSTCYRARGPRGVWRRLAGVILLMFFSTPAHASMFKGESLDKMADVLTWVVLVLAPIIGIVVFLLIHILPEKIAEKRGHPQAKAIQCLCLLSLVFGGLLWPLAWLWAYAKPVLYKMAYGTDKVASEHGKTAEPEPGNGELQRLRNRVAELESKLGGNGQKGSEG